jgi:hypothetical protein
MRAASVSPEVRRSVRLEQFTIGYNVVEMVVAVGAGLAAGLVSLVGFGVGSGIEVAAAGVVLARLYAEVRGGSPDAAPSGGHCGSSRSRSSPWPRSDGRGSS